MRAAIAGILYKAFGRQEDWAPDDNKMRMRRWDGSRWIYREMTDEEREEAMWWWSIR